MAGWWTDEGDLLDASGLLPPPAPFHGRRRELAALESAVGPGVRLALYPTVDGAQGDAGVGVSSLLREVVRRSGLSTLGWTREVDGGLLVRAVHRWGAVLGATAPPDDEEDGHLLRVLRALPRGDAPLLVLDGVDVAQRAELTRWLGLLPPSVGVLLAAEVREAVPEGVDLFGVPPLQTVEALGLLRQELGERLPQNLAVALADVSGRLPLALQLVGRRRSIGPSEEALLLAEAPTGDAPELASMRRLVGNSAAVHAFMALYLSLPPEAQRALRLLAAWPEGAIGLRALASSLRVEAAELEAALLLAQELGLVRGAGGRWTLHRAVAGWLHELSHGLGEERALAASVVAQARGSTWQDLLVLLDAVERARVAGDREALLGMTERLVLGDALLLRAGLHGRATALAADVLRMPGTGDRRAAALERWLRGGDVAVAVAEAPVQRPVKRSKAVEALRAELVEVTGEASIAGAEAAARAGVWLEGGRAEAEGLDEAPVRSALRALQELAARADGAAQDAQSSLDEVLFATSADAIRAAATRSVDAAEQASRLADDAQRTFEELRALAAKARAERARAVALRAAIAELGQEATRTLEEAREQVRARRSELPEALEGRMAAAWARVSPALSRAITAQRELEREPDGDGLAQQLAAARDAHARVMAGCRDAVVAAEEAAEVKRLAGEAVAWRDELAALQQRAAESAQRFRVTRDRVRDALGTFAAGDEEAEALVTEVSRMEQAVSEALAELDGLVIEAAEPGTERAAATRRAQRAQAAVGRAAVDALSLLPRAEETGRRLDQQNAERWLGAARERAAAERAAIEARLVELSGHLGSARELPRARTDAAVRRSVEEVIAAHATLETGAEVAVRALREVERATSREVAEPAMEAGLGHVASVREAGDRVVQLLVALGVAVQEAESSEIEQARAAAAGHAATAEAAAERARAAREEAAALMAPMETRNALASLQRVVDAHERALFALGHARDAAERGRAASRPADAQRAAVAAEGAARSVEEAAEAADEGLGRCRDVHAAWVEDRRRASLLGEDLRGRVARCRTAVREEADTLAELRRLTAEPVSTNVTDALRAADRWLAEAQDALLHAEHAVAELTSQGDAGASDAIITAAGAAINSFEEALQRIDEELVRAREAHADAVALRLRREELGQRLDMLLEETAAIVEAAARNVGAIAEVWSAEDPGLLVPAQEELGRAEDGRERLRELVGGLDLLDAHGLTGRASVAEDVAEDVAAASERARALAEDAEREGQRLREQRARAAAMAHDARVRAARDLLARLQDVHGSRTVALARLRTGRPWADEVAGDTAAAVSDALQALGARLHELAEAEPAEADQELLGLARQVDAADPVLALDTRLIAWEAARLRDSAGRLDLAADLLAEEARAAATAAEVPLPAADRAARWATMARSFSAWLRSLERFPEQVDPAAAADAIAVTGAELGVEAAAAVGRAREEHARRERSRAARRALDAIVAERRSAEERVAALVSDAAGDAEGLEDYPAVRDTLAALQGLLSSADAPPELGEDPGQAWAQVYAAATGLGGALRRVIEAHRAVERLADEVRTATLVRVRTDRQRAEALSADALAIDEEVEAERAEAVLAAQGEPELAGVLRLVEDAAAEVRERVGVTMEAAGVVARAASLLRAREALSRVEAGSAILQEARATFGVAVGALHAGLEAAALHARERAQRAALGVVGAVRERELRVRDELEAAVASVDGWTSDAVAGLRARLSGARDALGALAIDLHELEALAGEEVDAALLDRRADDLLTAVGGLEGHAASLVAELRRAVEEELPAELEELEADADEAVDALQLDQAALEDRAAALAERASGLDLDAPEELARARDALAAVQDAVDIARAAREAVVLQPTRAEGLARVAEACAARDGAVGAFAEAAAALEALEEAAGRAELLRDARVSGERQIALQLSELAAAVDELELTLEATRAEFGKAAPELRSRWSELFGGWRALGVVAANLAAREGEPRAAAAAADVAGVVAALGAEIAQRQAEAASLLGDLRGLVDAQIRFASDARDLLEGRIAVRRAAGEALGLVARARRAVQQALDAAARTVDARACYVACLAELPEAEAAARDIGAAAAAVEGVDAATTRALRAEATAALERLRAATRRSAGLAGRAEWLAGEADAARRAAQEAEAAGLRARAQATLVGASLEVSTLAARVRRAAGWAVSWSEVAVQEAVVTMRDELAAAERLHRATRAAAERALGVSHPEACRAHLEVAERACTERDEAIARARQAVDRVGELIKAAHAARVEARAAILEHRRIAGEVSSKLSGEAGNVQRRIALFERGLDVARRRGDAAELWGWLVDLADLYLTTGRVAEASLLLDEALPLGRSERAAAQVLLRMSRAARAHRPEDAVALAERAVAVGRGDEELVGVCQIELSHARRQAERTDGAADAAEDALRRFRALGDGRMAGVAGVALAQALAAGGRVAEALRAAAAAEVDLLHAGDEAAAAGATLLAARLMRVSGDRGAAVVTAERATGLLAHSEHAAAATAELARAWTAAGHPHRALRLLQGASDPGGRAVAAEAWRAAGLGRAGWSPGLALAASKDVRRRLRRGGAVGMARDPQPSVGAMRAASGAFERAAEAAARRQQDAAAALHLAHAAGVLREAALPEAAAMMERARRAVDRSPGGPTRDAAADALGRLGR